MQAEEHVWVPEEIEWLRSGMNAAVAASLKAKDAGEVRYFKMCAWRD